MTCRGLIARILVALILVSIELMAQAPSGGISGTVKDSSGAVVPGATVSLRNIGTGIVRTLITDSQGRYRAPDLSLGQYEIEARMPGFRTEFKTGVKLTVGQEVVVGFVLSVGEATERVEVTAETPLVETTGATLSGLVDDRQIRELPLNGRSFDELIALQAGTNLHNATRKDIVRTTEYSIEGNRTASNRFLVDGTESGHANIFNNPGSAAGTNLGVDAIQEFRIFKSAYDASYGKRMGGQIVMVTRSGTNNFHGALFHFLRNSALDARNFFDRADVPPFKRNNFGASFGGRIIPNRTFFFGSYEGVRHRLGLSNVAFVLDENARKGLLPDPSDSSRLVDVGLNPVVVPYINLSPLPNGRNFGNGAGELFTNPSQPLRDDAILARLDHAVSDSDSIFGSLLFDSSDLNTPDPNAHAAQFRIVRSYIATVQYQRIISPQLIDQARVGFNRGWNEFLSFPTVPIEPSLPFVPGEVLGSISLGGSAFEGANLSPTGTAGFNTLYVNNNYQLADQLVFVRGAHNLKFGAEFNRIQQNIPLNRVTGRGAFTFRTSTELLRGIPQRFQGLAPGTSNSRYWRQNYIGYYVQDDIQLRPGLTLNLGLRHEFTTLPTEARDHLSNFLRIPAGPFSVPATEPRLGEPLYNNNSQLNFAPRVGLAWDVTGNGKTAIRGSFGLFYDQNTILFTRYADGNPPFALTLELDNPPFPHPDFSQPASLQSTADSIDLDLKVPTSVQYTLSLQRNLWEGGALTAAYVGSHSYHLMVAGHSNPALPQILPDGRFFIPAGTRRGNPALGRGDYLQSIGDSHYHSMQLTLTQSTRRNLRYALNYTLSKNIDNASNVVAVQATNTPSFPQNPFDLSADKGLSALHIAQNFVFNFSWGMPFGTGKRFLNSGIGATVLGGWQLMGITSIHSGSPFTVRTGIDRSRLLEFGRADRPDLVAGCSNNPVLGGPDNYFDLACFELPPPGFFGNAGRTTVIGPGFVNQDLSLIKNISLRQESLNLQIRAEFFNLFNRANFSVPNGIVTAASGSRIQSTVTTSRQIQFGLKLTF